MKTMVKVDVSKLGTFEAVDAARTANRGLNGRITNEALDRRLCARTRDLAIRMLGFAPEDRSSYETRYAATTGELVKWALGG